MAGQHSHGYSKVRRHDGTVAARSLDRNLVVSSDLNGVIVVAEVAG